MAFGAFYMIGRPLSSITITMIATDYCIVDKCLIAYYIYYIPVTFFHSIPIIASPIYLFLKYWLIYYDIKVIQATFDCEWRSLINPKKTMSNEMTKKNSKNSNLHQITQNWYLSNRSKYGNIGYLKRKAFILSFILCNISMLLWFIFWPTTSIGGLISYAYDALCLFIINIATIICYYRTPKFIDNFYIRNEMSLITISLLFGIFLFIISAIIITFFISNDDTGLWSNIVYTHSNCITFLLAFYLQTQYVFSKCKVIIATELIASNSKNSNGIDRPKLKRRHTYDTYDHSKSHTTGHDNHMHGNRPTMAITNGISSGSSGVSAVSAVSGGSVSAISGDHDTTADKLERISTASSAMTPVSTSIALHGKTPTPKEPSAVSVENSVKKYKKEVSLSLKQCLVSDQALEIFMVHLSKEFSFEIILSTIEFNQFLSILQNQFKNLKETLVQQLVENVENMSHDQLFYSSYDKILFSEQSYNNVSKMKILQLTQSMPQSFIIVENMKNCLSLIKFMSNNQEKKQKLQEMKIDKPVLCLKNNDSGKNDTSAAARMEINNLLITLSVFYNIGFEFYYKYIRVDSELEINIGHHLRQRFFDFFEKYNLINCLFCRNMEKNAQSKKNNENDKNNNNTFFLFANNFNDNLNFDETKKYYFENYGKIHDMMHIMYKKMNGKYNENMENDQKTFVDYVEYSIDNATDTENEIEMIPDLNNVEFLTLNHNDDDNNYDSDTNISKQETKQEENDMSPSSTMNENNINIDIIENESMVFELNINDIAWMLELDQVKNNSNNNNNNKELKQIGPKLKTQIFTFLFILTRMMYATNKELYSLLEFSFARFTNTQQYAKMVSKLSNEKQR